MGLVGIKGPCFDCGAQGCGGRKVGDHLSGVIFKPCQVFREGEAIWQLMSKRPDAEGTVRRKATKV